MAKINVTTTSANMTLGGNTVNVYGAGTINTININNSSGKLVVYDGGTVNNATVTKDESKVSVYQGGVINNTLIAADQTYVSVYNGGKANKTNITSNGSMFIRSGGTASETTITGGDMKVYAGGVADGVTLNKFGYTHVFGGTVNNAVINSAGHLNVSSGGKINAAAINDGGDLKLASGVTSQTNIYSGGKMTVSQGVADGTTVNAGGSMVIIGGSAVNTILTGEQPRMRSVVKVTEATLHLNGANALATDTEIRNGGVMNVSSGTANGVDVGIGGLLNVSGGKVTDTVISSGGGVVVTGGEFIAGNVSSGGTMTISGGKVADTAISSGGMVTVINGTIDLEISSGGNVNGFSFNQNTDLTKISLTDVNVDNAATLYAGQQAAGISMGYGAELTVYGTVSSISSENACSIIVKNGGKITGKLQFSDPGSRVFFEKGGIYDFDLRNFSTGNEPIVDFSCFDGTPDLMITVSNQQSLGTYILSEGLDDFTGSITFSNGSKIFGTITADGSKAHNFSADHAYWLTFENGTLYLNSAYEDRTPPVQPVIEASTTAATNKPVTVTATFSNDSVIKEYSLDKTTWLTYTTGIEMSKNGTVYFRAADADGNMCEVVSYAVKNIDLTAPAKPTAKVNTTAIVKGTVTVTATFSKDSTLKQYSLDNKTWKTYTAGIKMSKNGTVYFRCRDAAGNYSAVTAYKVTNIYTPVAKDITGVKSRTGKDNITLSWSKITPAKGDKVTYQVKMTGEGESESWTVKTASISEKGLDVGFYTFSIRSVVTAPNMTVYGAWKTVSVNLKDIVKPVVKKLTATVNGYSATLKIDGDDNDDIVKYIITYGKKSMTVNTVYDNKDKEYEEDISVKLSNLPVGKVAVSVVAYDAAGNKSTAKKVNLTIKDVTPPSKVATLYAPSVTNKYKGTFSWTAATDNSGKIAKYEIQLDNGKIYTSTKTSVSISNLTVGNHTYRVRAIDKDKNVGAWSDVNSFTVKDYTAPKISKITSTVKGYSATLKITATDNVKATKYVITYGKISQTVTSNTATLTGLAVGKVAVSVVAYDAAGNKSTAKKVNLTVKDVTAPAKVATLYAPGVTNKYKGTFSWSAATDNSGKIAKYEIQLDNGKIYTSTKTTLSVSNLKVGSHTYRVRAIDKDKNVGAWSAVKSFTVKDMTAPATVSLTAKVSGNNATLTWKKPKDNVGVTKYVLKYGNTSVTLSGSATKYVISGLNKGTYSYSMIAYDAAGNASKAKTGKITIKQELAPAQAAEALYAADFNSAPEALFAPQDDILAYSDTLKNDTVIASADDLTASDGNKDKFMQLA